MGQAAPLEFDASTFEIWGALLTGGRLAILSGPALDPGRLERFVADKRVTTLWLTAGLFHTFARHRPGVFAPLRTLLTGGGAVRGDRMQEVMDVCRGLRWSMATGRPKTPPSQAAIGCNPETGLPNPCRSGALFREQGCMCLILHFPSCRTASRESSIVPGPVWRWAISAVARRMPFCPRLGIPACESAVPATAS